MPILQRILSLIRGMIYARKPDIAPLDLVTVQPYGARDVMTRWVAEEWIPLYNDCWSAVNVMDPGDSRYVSVQLQSRSCRAVIRPNRIWQVTNARYVESTLLKCTSVIAMVFACLLLTLAIGILSIAETKGQKLGYIVGFTAIFSIALTLLVNPKTSRLQVFIATAT